MYAKSFVKVTGQSITPKASKDRLQVTVVTYKWPNGQVFVFVFLLFYCFFFSVKSGYWNITPPLKFYQQFLSLRLRDALLWLSFTQTRRKGENITMFFIINDHSRATNVSKIILETYQFALPWMSLLNIIKKLDIQS